MIEFEDEKNAVGGYPVPAGDRKDVVVSVPPGLVGKPEAVPLLARRLHSSG